MLNTAYIFPIISLVGLIYIGYRYINLFVKINQLEHEFSSIVNHTFRTPLTRILWLAKELEGELNTENRLSYIKDINNATERILSIVEIVAGIKKINDISGYNFKPISMKVIVKNSINKYSELIKEKNIDIKISPIPETPFLLVDIKKISIVIDTLIENAIYYTPKGGKVMIGSKLKNNKFIFYVKDNGIGLNFIDKLRIFTRFYRNKKAILMNTEGMGLTLYLSKKIIRKHKGKISAQSNGINKGSIFTITIPFNI